MWPFLKNLWHSVIYDEVAVRRWGRGLGVWIGAQATQMLSDPNWPNWSLKEWTLRVGVSSITGGAVMVNLGEKNPKQPPPPEKG